MARHTTRSVRCIKFKITVKSEAEKEAAAHAINKKYRDYINAWSAKHLSNKLGQYGVELCTDPDIFVFNPPTNKALPPDDDQPDSFDGENFSTTSCSSETDFMDFAMLDDIDPEDMPF